MTFGRDRHPDELISASLTGDITREERAQLDAHLAACARCRATLEAFSVERSLLSGLLRATPPGDLGAKVRAGIESGTATVPWWRRPSTWIAGVATLGTVAAALLAVVILSDLARGPVGNVGSPTPTASSAASAEPSQVESSLTPEPSVAATASAAPLPTIGPDPVGYLQYEVADQQASMSVNTSDGAQPIVPQGYGLPVNASLSPGGDWLAFQLLGDGSGLVDTYAYRAADGRLVPLFRGAADSPFAILSWSADGTLLAFTGLSEDGQQADVWIFNTDIPDAGPRQLTDTGRAFAASFYGGPNGTAWLWVSTAADQPVTDRVAVTLDAPISAAVDPATASLRHWDGTFLPVRTDQAISQGGAVSWSGRMALDAGGWHFAQAGMLYITYPTVEGEFEDFTVQPLFDTLAITNGGEAFRSARLAWAPDGDGLAVWDAQWQGIPQPAGFPDSSRVYFGHPSSGVFIGPDQALDAADTAGGTVINVAMGGGQYLALTVQTDAGSEGGSFGPTAELRLVTRNTGATPDEVSTLGQDRVWYGPAFYHAQVGPN